MEGANEDSKIHLQDQFFVTIELIVGEESGLENVEAPLASESHTEYLMNNNTRNVNILQVILYLLLCYTSWIITLYCIQTYF